VFQIAMPPLRERRADILPLARMFAEGHGRRDPGFLEPVAGLLARYPWPGNVRELGNAVEHAVALARGGDVRPEHLPEEVAMGEPPSDAPGGLRSLAEVERAHVLHVLDAWAGIRRGPRRSSASGGTRCGASCARTRSDAPLDQGWINDPPARLRWAAMSTQSKATARAWPLLWVPA